MRAANPTRAVLAGACLAAAALAAGCAPDPAESVEVETAVVATNPELATDPSVPVVEDIAYGVAGGAPLLLDACLPPGADPATDPARAAIVLVHGGSWARGSKSAVAWRAMCQWLARSGYPAFSVDYRLAPEHPYPAAIDDVARAVEWLREDAQVRRFGIDPERIGAFGGSAGGNLAALLGTRGEGAQDRGSRVAAVVALSAPTDLTGVAVTDDFAPVQLAYLGCADYAACAAAREASPVAGVDASDPPFLVVHATHEMIPVEQAELLVRALRDAGVAVDYVTVSGSLHSVALVDAALKERILDFYAGALAPTRLPQQPVEAAAGGETP